MYKFKQYIDVKIILFISIIPAIAADFIIVKKLPEKYKIIKIFFAIHGIGGIIASAIFWVYTGVNWLL